MNIALYNSTIDTNLTALFDILVFGIIDQILINRLPGSFRQRFNVLVEDLFFEPLIGNTNLAKTADALGIDYMKSQLLIGKTENHFDDGGPQNLLRSHAAGATFDGHRSLLAKILHHVVADGRIAVNDAIDDFQLIRLGMIDFGRHQRHLFLSLFAHFVVGSFHCFVVILGCWRFLTYYKKQKKSTAKCAFFMYSG